LPREIKKRRRRRRFRFATRLAVNVPDGTVREKWL
jgi:hypothetical protein